MFDLKKIETVYVSERWGLSSSFLSSDLKQIDCQKTNFSSKDEFTLQQRWNQHRIAIQGLQPLWATGKSQDSKRRRHFHREESWEGFSK